MKYLAIINNGNNISYEFYEAVSDIDAVAFGWLFMDGGAADHDIVLEFV